MIIFQSYTQPICGTSAEYLRFDAERFMSLLVLAGWVYPVGH